MATHPIKTLLAHHGVLLECFLGDITNVSCDAIVNPSNTALWLGSGVSNAIRERGGGIIQRDLERHAGPIPHGSAVTSFRGKLTNCRGIIHAAVLDADSPEVKIRESVTNALLLADKTGYRHVAFPAIGTGVGGVLPARAAREMLAGITDYLAAKQTALVTKIGLVMNKPETYEAFCGLCQLVKRGAPIEDLFPVPSDL